MKLKIELEIFSLCIFYLKLKSLSNPPTCSLSGLFKGRRTVTTLSEGNRNTEGLHEDCCPGLVLISTTIIV